MTEEQIIAHPQPAAYPDVQQQYADFLRGDYVNWQQQYLPTEIFLRDLGMDEATRRWLESRLLSLADDATATADGYTAAGQTLRSRRYNTREIPANRHMSALQQAARKTQMLNYADGLRRTALGSVVNTAIGDKRIGGVSLGQLSALQQQRTATNAGIASANRTRLIGGLAAAGGQYATAAAMGNPITGAVMAGMTILGSI